jgi:hypothetical protein
LERVVAFVAVGLVDGVKVAVGVSVVVVKKEFVEVEAPDELMRRLVLPGAVIV